MTARIHRRAAALLVAALTASGCSAAGSGTPKQGDGAAEAVSPTVVSIGTAAESRGPAAPVAEAKSGGIVTVLQTADFKHLDPAMVYATNASTASQLFTRCLTRYKQVGGKAVLVGDLATDTGTPSDGGRTWSFTLKDGLKFDDGSDVTAEQVKYGIERSYDKSRTGGPNYVQTWLSGADYANVYPGPSGGASLPDSVLEAKGKSLVFHLKEAHADFPFAVAWPSTAPVQQGKDGKDYDRAPQSTGPYRIVRHDDTSMVLERNQYWDPATDPLRHNYPDGWKFEFGVQSQQTSQRIAAQSGTDKNALSLTTQIDASFVPQSQTDPDLKARTVSGMTPYVRYFNINTARVTDLEVRKALYTAFPKQQLRQIYGGSSYGEIATTILSPATIGYQGYDPFPGLALSGDPGAAKQILDKAGKTGTKIVYAYSQDESGEKGALLISAALAKAGFDVVKKPIEASSYLDAIIKKDNGFDLYTGGWSADWPSGAGTIPALFKSSNADGSYNYSKLADPAVDAEIQRINQLADIAEQGKAWAALDKKIMEQVPVIPFVDTRSTLLVGSNIGGAYIGSTSSALSPLDIYLKSVD
ncbi:ABC transporter substrate-binding protein [Kitasatospora indigofera]|uniref:ABC transporter substrate-binding protein n=1 Tax=Kitasatospora indigofera TaxID=67307 RepID=UPI0036B202B7